MQPDSDLLPIKGTLCHKRNACFIVSSGGARESRDSLIRRLCLETPGPIHPVTKPLADPGTSRSRPTS